MTSPAAAKAMLKKRIDENRRLRPQLIHLLMETL